MSIVFSIPNDFAQLVPWLERQVVGMNLRSLVGELQILHRPDGGTHLHDVCEDRLSDVLDGGLGVLSPDRVTQMLINPQTLVELQELAFLSGSEFWGQLAAAGDSGRRSELLKSSILSQLKPFGHDTTPGFAQKTDPGFSAVVPDVPREPSVRSKVSSLPSHSVKPVEAGARRSLEEKQELTQVAASAVLGKRPGWFSIQRATVLLAVVLLFGVALKSMFLTTRVVPWGLNSPDLLAFHGDETSFLNHLAVKAGEWSSKRPDSAELLKVRIRQYSDGCKNLIESLKAGEVTQLSDSTSAWLQQVCLDEQIQLNALVASLDDGTISFKEAQERADRLSTQLVAALRTGPATLL